MLADLGPLRESTAFRRLWFGSSISSVGGALTAFAVPLQVYDVTHSSFAVGVVGVAELVPTLAIGLLSGTIADRTSRRKLIFATSGGLGAISAVLAILAIAGLHRAWPLYALVCLQAALRAVEQPARRSLIPVLLPDRLLPAGLALDRLSFQITLTLGPALAGALVADPMFGLRACYLLDSASYAAALCGAAMLPEMPVAGPLRPSRRALGEGLRVIVRSEMLLGAFLADLAATLFGLPVALFPAINAQRFGGDPRTLGLFGAAIGVGGLASALLSGMFIHVSRRGLAMLGAVAVWGATFAGFAEAASLWLTLLLLAVAGAVDTVTVVLRSTIVQEMTTERLRGRVSAAEYVIGAGGGQLGNLEAGALGSATSPGLSALVGGLVTIVCVVAIGAALPGFARYRRDVKREVAEPASEQQAILGPPGAGE